MSFVCRNFILFSLIYTANVNLPSCFQRIVHMSVVWRARYLCIFVFMYVCLCVARWWTNKIESTIVDKWCQETNDILHLKVSLLRVGHPSFPWPYQDVRFYTTPMWSVVRVLCLEKKTQSIAIRIDSVLRNFRATSHHFNSWFNHFHVQQ